MNANRRYLWPGCLFLAVLLLSACSTPATATLVPLPTRTDLPRPTIALTRTALPSITPAGVAAPNSTSATQASPVGASSVVPTTEAVSSAVPSATSALVAASPNIDATLRATFIPTQAVAPGDPPPLSLKLPAGWKFTYTLIPISDGTTQATMNVAAYAGPVSDKGTGFLYILWNFPTILPLNPGALPTSVQDAQRQSSLADGFRLLHGTVIDSSCTFGNYGQRDFKVGGQTAVGQYFQVAECQANTPDIVGWYAGLWEKNRAILFYAYVQPVSAYNNGRADLQKILDSVDFNATGASSTPLSVSPTAAPDVPVLTPTTTPELN